ncbi:hypothetical protein [Nakamurella multipartita]|uniref:Uncharacterized protein n=1 Tax=Nakamurella multipartita (strain ATCC 700099 / DSM 44233 / CIP 104796 / JCM 9543 / NBRC 105858 / Y-104) TaxID=479431 RepID=C8X8K9_NAKMY|nr:hypothetical protein [Nakamurella multipartita]ACV79064.1 hypothetical protein Namu_2718 [Nakamurella multipartita DSM 44233]
MTRRTRRRPNPLSGWGTATEVPAVRPPDEAKGARRYRWYRRAILAGVVLNPILALALLVTLGTSPSAGRSADTAQRSSAGQAVATTELWRWLPQVMPGAQIVHWEGADAGPVPTTGAGGAAAGAPTERNTFVVADRNGGLYEATVMVTLDPREGVSAVGTPSLVPLPGGAASSVASRAGGTTEWTGLVIGRPPQPVADAVNTWASAFTAGDRAKLRLAVADRDTTHAYLPLTGVESVEVTTEQAATWPVADGEEPDGRMLVRARLTLVWQGTPASAGPTAPAQAAISYDLLVIDADTGAPRVVAWGGPGAGPTLTPFVNAVPAELPENTAAPVAPVDGRDPSATGTATPTITATTTTTRTVISTGGAG